MIEWHKQGLPEFVNSLPIADEFFGFSPQIYAPVNIYLKPGFEHQLLEEDEDHRIIIDGGGVKCMVNKQGASIPKHFNFLVGVL